LRFIASGQKNSADVLFFGRNTVRYTILRAGHLGKSVFGFFWIFNFLQFAIDGKNNSKTKVEKVFFFIFMSSDAEMS
jgi:hypothetical protein